MASRAGPLSTRGPAATRCQLPPFPWLAHLSLAVTLSRCHPTTPLCSWKLEAWATAGRQNLASANPKPATPLDYAGKPHSRFATLDPSDCRRCYRSRTEPVALCSNLVEFLSVGQKGLWAASCPMLSFFLFSFFLLFS